MHVFLKSAIVLLGGDFHHYSKITAITVIKINWSVSHPAWSCLLTGMMLQNISSLLFARMKEEFYFPAWNLFSECTLFCCMCIHISTCLINSCKQSCASMSIQIWKLLVCLYSLSNAHRAWFQSNIHPCIRLCKNDYLKDLTSWLQHLSMMLSMTARLFFFFCQVQRSIYNWKWATFPHSGRLLAQIYLFFMYSERKWVHVRSTRFKCRIWLSETLRIFLVMKTLNLIYS